MPGLSRSSDVFSKPSRGPGTRAAGITDEVIEDALGGLPEDKRHCSNMGAVALYDATMNHVFRTVEAERAKRKEVRDAAL